MKKISLEVPSWIEKAVAREKFLRSLCNEALMKVEYYRSLMKPFERKYSASFEDFKKKIESSKEESFKAWDDLIEWEAYFRAHKEWTKKYEELKNVWSNN